MVNVPFRLNLCPPGAPVFPGYTNFAPAAYDAGLGYGYEDPIDGAAFERSVNIMFSPYDFNLAPWIPDTVTVTPNDGIAPDGTKTADRIVTGGIASKSIRQDITISGAPANRTFTMSCWVWNDLADRDIQLQIDAVPGGGSIFQKNVTVPKAQGWTRLTFTVTFAPTDGGNVVRFLLRPLGFGSTLAWGGKAAESNQFEDDDRYDTGHRVDSGVDQLRIDLAPGVYDVLCAIGDPTTGTAKTQVAVSDAGNDTTVISAAEALSPGQYVHRGVTKAIDQWLRIQLGKSVGGPFPTPLQFVTIARANDRGSTLRMVDGRRGAARSITPSGARRVP